MLIKLCFDAGNDEYIILVCNCSGGRLMSGFKVIEGIIEKSSPDRREQKNKKWKTKPQSELGTLQVFGTFVKENSLEKVKA